MRQEDDYVDVVVKFSDGVIIVYLMLSTISVFGGNG